jgi:thiol-disulfide isomerase/thioredoxin
MSNKQYALYGVTTIILLTICTYMIKNIRPPPKDTNVEKVCELFYFYTSWCPYCKKAAVEWNKFKNEWDNKKYNGYTLHFQEIDCDVNETFANKYNVTKYPTIKLIKDNIVIDFDAKPTVESLTHFLSSGFE